MDCGIFCNVSSSPLSVKAAVEFAASPAHGAFDLFLGRVRNNNLGRDVRGVSYDVHETLAIKAFQRICEDTRVRWGHDLRLWLEHYQGYLDIGGVSVVIAVSSAHRAEAFQACRFMLEAVKHRAPVWKQEHYADGDSDWVKGHSLCQHKGIWLDCLGRDDPSVEKRHERQPAA